MEVITGPGNARRLRTLKRRKEEKKAEKKIKLERVLGLTVPSNAGLASSPATGIVAYPAGCTVVLYNPRKNRQSHVTNLSRKTITSVGFSEDGRYLVTGECGHLPSVRIWDVHDKTMVAEFSGHKFGINCVAFAPNNKYVVSVGSQHDMIVNVWDWKNNAKVASNKISTKVKAISFSENGNYFVTAGNRHVKFWYLEYSRSKYKDPMPLMGRSAILGEQRNNYFCDVSCGRGEMGDSTYAITKSGLLCEFNNRRLLDKWVELRTQTANCLSVGEDYVFIGCGDGIIRCFSPHTLQFITTLPRTHYLGVDVSKGLSISHMATHPPTAKYPDAKAITYDEQNFKVTVVYNDHSIYVWDVRDIKKVGKSHSFIFHSACIWGLEIYSSQGGSDPGKRPGGGPQKPVLPPGSFITCSSDDTIRIWNLNSNMSQSTLYRRNIYSDELLKTLYVDSELSHIKELDNSNLEKGSASGTGGTGPNGGETVVDQRNGVRCIRISPDGKHLASGDRAGNIRVHDLQFMDEICKIEAHDAEVLCLEYCGPILDSRGKYLLASASRDRLIHVFNATRDYKFLTTLDDHSSSITAVKFLPSPYVQMVSCGADKSIIFRDISVDKQKGLPEFSRGTHVVGKTTLYDMEVDHNAKHILTACQDRNIRIYTVGNGKHLRTFKGSVSDDGTLIKVVLDHSGLYAATSCTDKTLAIYDYYSGECMATMFGHSELVTGLKFTEDCKHLISVSGDGCIFIWRLPHEMTANMLARTAGRKDSSSRVYIGSNNNALVPGSNEEEDFSDMNVMIQQQQQQQHPTINREEENEDDDSYRFSVGKLPFWAKKQMTESSGKVEPPASSPPKSPGPVTGKQQGVDYPKGRWAQRVGSRGMTVKSHYDSDSVIPFPQKNDSKEESSFEGFKQQQQKELMDEGFDYNSLSEVDRGSSPLDHSVYLKDLSSQRSKLRLDALPSHLRPSNRNTDESSSVGGSLYLDNNTEHDADIDEYSDALLTQDDGGESTEPENTERTMYFGQSEETPSVYTVNAMDVEELRRSQRRSSKKGATMTAPVERRGSSEALTTPSQDSEDSEDSEEEEVSTPSADKNILSLLSVSSENVDLVGRRERFLKSNFESLGTNSNSGGLVIDSNSFSNQYREGSALQRNASTIARAQSFRDNEQNRKREELQRRIEETKRKLQNIGYRSMIKGSQSISDLSTHIPEKDFSESSRPASRNSGRVDDCRIIGNFSNSEREEDLESGLRRTCSLSDLNKPSTPRRILPAPPATVSGKKSSSSSKYHWRSSNPPSSSSLGGSYYYHHSHQGSAKLHGPPVLHDRPIVHRNGGKNLGVHKGGPEFAYGEDVNLPSYMRSTSASVKKEKQQQLYQQQQQLQHQSNTIPRRKTSIGQMSSVSTSDLRSSKEVSGGGSVTRLEDSSSEENSDRRSGRRRSSSQDRRHSILRNSIEGGLNIDHRARSERDLSKVTKVKVRGHSREDPFLKQHHKNKMKTTTLIVNNSGGSGSNLEELGRDPTNPNKPFVELRPFRGTEKDFLLVDKTAAALVAAADNLVQCYKSIAIDYDLNDNLKAELLGKLSKSAGSAQQTLKQSGLSHTSSSEPLMKSSSRASRDNHKKPEEHPRHSADLQSNPYFLHMIENYSNMMLHNQRETPNNGRNNNHHHSSQEDYSDHRSSQGGPSWC